MKKITRWYSKKVQLRQYEPVESGCMIETDCEEKDLEKTSQKLYDFCVKQVEAELQRKIEDQKNFESKRQEKMEKQDETGNE